MRHSAARGRGGTALNLHALEIQRSINLRVDRQEFSFTHVAFCPRCRIDMEGLEDEEDEEEGEDDTSGGAGDQEDAAEEEEEDGEEGDASTPQEGGAAGEAEGNVLYSMVEGEGRCI